MNAMRDELYSTHDNIQMYDLNLDVDENYLIIYEQVADEKNSSYINPLCLSYEYQRHMMRTKFS